ncbi:unnamed protein product [Clonostachys byssicola]|uniref:Adenosine deaminase n=1 Tax=Clonostachys byssicola TaxID=160290 RepID=A0A9N9UDM8_9HYPO|nr:unnamed protein product [Clonostachys byssicola]
MLFSLAAKNRIELPSDDPAFASLDSLCLQYQNFTSLDDFLRYYLIGFEVLLTASDFEFLTYEHVKNAYAQTVRHTEVFFDPQAHIALGVSYQTLLSVSEMLSHGHFEDGILIGFGMSSTEVGRYPSLYSSVYATLREADVENLTAHYGEEGPPEYVAAAMSDLGVKRIDHGRRAIEDQSLFRRLVDAKIMLTVCPISNVMLKGVQDIMNLPIRHFLDLGVRFSINSDDPAYFGGSLLDNYCAIQEAFDLSMADWKDIARNSVEGSWCSEGRKMDLKNMIDRAFADVIIPNN